MLSAAITREPMKLRESYRRWGVGGGRLGGVGELLPIGCLLCLYGFAVTLIVLSIEVRFSVRLCSDTLRAGKSVRPKTGRVRQGEGEEERVRKGKLNRKYVCA